MLSFTCVRDTLFQPSGSPFFLFSFLYAWNSLRIKVTYIYRQILGVRGGASAPPHLPLPPPLDTNQIQHETLPQIQKIDRYKPNHNQNPKSVKYPPLWRERERKRESLLVIDVEPLRTRTQIPTNRATQNTEMRV